VTDTFGSTLRHTLDVGDAVVVGLGSRVGARVFAALAPAAHAAGSGLFLGLTGAAVVAYCNAMSSARLAVLHSFGVLTYYAVANASAWTLDSWPFMADDAGGTGGGARRVPGAGVLAPWVSVTVGAEVLVVGVVAYAVRRGRRRAVVGIR
jgi:APA family basic amino acid/polyamine antiporter